MIAKEEPEDARELLVVLEGVEHLTQPEDLKGVGMLMVENSEWLRERAAFPMEPIKMPLTPDPTAPEEDSLEEFLSLLYQDQ